jgi:hypothetical protein
MDEASDSALVQQPADCDCSLSVGELEFIEVVCSLASRSLPVSVEASTHAQERHGHQHDATDSDGAALVAHTLQQLYVRCALFAVSATPHSTA